MTWLDRRDSQKTKRRDGTGNRQGLSSDTESDGLAGVGC